MKPFLTKIWQGIRLVWPTAVASIVIGVATGFLGAFFASLINWATDLFTHNSWMVWLLPAAGIPIALMYRHAKNVGGTNDVLEALRGHKPPSMWVVPLIFVSTFITRLFGGSVGTEGAAIQIGSGIAEGLGRITHLTPERARVVMMSGVAGAFASIVGTPIAAIILAIEMAGVGTLYYAAILPCAISSAISYGIAHSYGSGFLKLFISDVPPISALVLLQVVALAALSGLVSILLCVTFKQAGRLYERAFPSSPILRVIVGGLVIALLTFWVGSSKYNDGGMDLVSRAFSGTASPEEFALKILFTALTLGAGFKGGAIVPTLVVGSSFGGFFGPLLGLSAPLSTGIGMSAVFCGAINCPMTSFVLGLEVFGAQGGLYFLIACAVAYVCSGYYGLYPAQKIWHSKITAEPIAKNAE